MKRKNVSHIETSGTNIKKHFGNVLLHSDAVMDEDLVINYMRMIDPVMCRKVLTQIYQPQQLGSSKTAVVGSYFRVFERDAESATANSELLVSYSATSQPNSRHPSRTHPCAPAATVLLERSGGSEQPDGAST